MLKDMVTGTGARGLVGAIPRVGEAIAPTAGMRSIPRKLDAIPIGIA